MRYLLVFLSAALIFSCGKKETRQATSPVTFQIKIFRLESEGGCKADTLPCASYEVSYPVFFGLSPETTDSLTRAISSAADVGNPETDTLSFETAGKEFIDGFEESKKEFPDMVMGWYYNSKTELNILSDTLISLSVTNEYFTGGAHGGYGTYFINVNPATGSKFTLDDFLKPGYQQVLNSLGEKSFRKELELAEGTSLAEEGYEFSDDHFALNDNYGFTKDGIVFVFNIYEIAPYVLGSQTVTISYSAMKDWLK